MPTRNVMSYKSLPIMPSIQGEYICLMQRNALWVGRCRIFYHSSRAPAFRVVPSNPPMPCPRCITLYINHLLAYSM